MTTPSRDLPTPGNEKTRGRKISLPCCISYARAGGLNWGRKRRINPCCGNHARGDTTVIGNFFPTRNMRSRINTPAMGWAACGNKVEHTTCWGRTSSMCYTPGQRFIYWLITRHAHSPIAFALDEMPRCCAQRRPRWAGSEQLQHSVGEVPCIAGAEQAAGLAVSDQLAVTAHVGRDYQTTLRHCLQRLQRCEKLGETHREPRIYQHIDEIVIALYLRVRHTAREYHLVRDAECLRLLFQRRLFIAATHQEQADIRQSRRHDRHGLQQQRQSFIGVERTDESQHGLAVELQRMRERRIGDTADLEMFDIHRIGYHRDLVRGNTACGDIAAQTLADAADRGGAFEHVCLQRACGAIARVAFAAGAV